MHARGNAGFENGSRGNAVADFFYNGKKSVGRAERIFDAGRCGAGRGNFVFGEEFFIAKMPQALRGNGGDERVRQRGNAEYFAFAFQLGEEQTCRLFFFKTFFRKHMAYKVGIVGVTGAVGQEILALLASRNFPVEELRPLASARSAGKTIEFGGKTWTIREATPESFEGLDFAIFSAGGSISKALAPEAAKRGCIVIDNSSAFRMDPNVPLVVPEINAHALKNHKGIIANPNCSTAITLMGLYPLHKAFGLKRFFASTYQAVSGTGAAAMEELKKQVVAWANGEKLETGVYPYQIAFNLIPHVDSFLEDGYTKEEMKMLNEGRKILELPELVCTCTCVRVPVFRAHSISVDAEFEKPVSVEAARKAIAEFVGAEVQDDPATKVYPMPLFYQNKVKCGVGRIRKNTAFDNGLALWVCGDQLWKGAALNAIQIAEEMDRQGLLKK